MCKYMNEGSGMAVLRIANPIGLDNEAKQFKMGRYINNNEVVWRIFGFDIHENYEHFSAASVSNRKTKTIVYLALR